MPPSTPLPKAVRDEQGVSRLAWRYAVLEVGLYAALLRWLLRRKDIPAGAEPWGYAQLVTPLMWLGVFGSATELVVLHLIIPRGSAWSSTSSARGA